MEEEEKLEEIELEEIVRNFLEVLKDVDLVMLNFNEIYRGIEQADKSQADKNQLFELAENIGVIRGYMKLLNMISKIPNINKNINKEIAFEMIKNLDLFSVVLIKLNRNDINQDIEQIIEQRMLAFTDVVMKLLEDILRK